MLFLESAEAFMSLAAGAPGANKHSRRPSTVGLKLMGANKTARGKGEDRLPGVSNYLFGKDPSRWRTDVPNFAKVGYTNIYPGIDLVYYGNQEGVLEHDFVVKPNADPAAISLVLQNAGKVIAGEGGGITLQTKSGNLELQKPTAYQVVDGRRKTVPAAYDLASGGRVSFEIGQYDRSSPLVIDPVLRYTYAIGGNDNQGSPVAAIAVDASQNTCIVGTTFSGSFPLDHAYQANCNCPGGFGIDGSGFISKVNAAGNAFVFSTYFGLPVDTFDPNGYELVDDPFIAGVVVDSTQRVYFVGYDPSTVGNYVAQLNAPGNALLYQTKLHGRVSAIALDASNNAYATGQTDGTFTPINSIAPTGSIYVEKVSSTGVVEYASEFGTSSNGVPFPRSIAVDSRGEQGESARLRPVSSTWDRKT